jgi:hypothetical protein
MVVLYVNVIVTHPQQRVTYFSFIILIPRQAFEKWENIVEAMALVIERMSFF